ncbi:MAG: hypothetical protein ACI9X4_001557 [Glaciecola sp.]
MPFAGRGIAQIRSKYRVRTKAGGTFFHGSKCRRNLPWLDIRFIELLVLDLTKPTGTGPTGREPRLLPLAERDLYAVEKFDIAVGFMSQCHAWK